MKDNKDTITKYDKETGETWIELPSEIWFEYFFIPRIYERSSTYTYITPNPYE